MRHKQTFGIKNDSRVDVFGEDKRIEKRQT